MSRSRKVITLMIVTAFSMCLAVSNGAQANNPVTFAISGALVSGSLISGNVVIDTDPKDGQAFGYVLSANVSVSAPDNINFPTVSYVCIIKNGPCEVILASSDNSSYLYFSIPTPHLDSFADYNGGQLPPSRYSAGVTFSGIWTRATNTYEPMQSGALIGPCGTCLGGISYEYEDVTDKTCKVAIGEYVELIGQLPPNPVAPSPWVIPAAIVGGYSAGEASPGVSVFVEPVLTLQQQAVGLYFYVPGTVQVSYFDNENHTSTVTFDVVGPSNKLTQPAALIVAIINPQGFVNKGASFGLGSNETTISDTGIQFTAKPNLKSGIQKYSWAQEVEQNVVWHYKLNGAIERVPRPIGLDKSFPYQTDPSRPDGGHTNDSPSVNLCSDDMQVIVNKKFHMFLMWRSAAEGSIPVPLGSLEWGWHGSAVDNLQSCGQPGWCIGPGPGGYSERFVSAQDAGSPSQAFPIWSSVTTNQPFPCD